MAGFTDHSRSDGFSSDGSQVVEFDTSLVAGLVRPMTVVVEQVLAEHRGQVAFAKDQDPVQPFAAECSNDAFADGVHPRGLRHRWDDPQLFGL